MPKSTKLAKQTRGEGNRKVTRPIIVSGIKPTGPLHIGNYLGMIKQSVQLQNSKKYRCFFFVADYHSLTERYDPKEKGEETLHIARAYLAAGLDPRKSTIFVQSHIPQHTNLTWIFSNLVGVGKMQGMIEYKEKLQQGEPANVGLFTYPILMAADILIYKATYVPIGEDQRQHLEVTREIARAFNRRFSKTFPEPKPLFTPTPRLMSLDNPGKKMSKSLPQGCLFLMDSPHTIREKIKRAVTDSGHDIIYNPDKKPAISNLLLIYSSFSGQPIKEIERRYGDRGYAEFKADLAEVLVKALAPFQNKYKVIARRQSYLQKTLRDGTRRAEAVAAKTFEEVREKVGLLTP